MHQTQTNEPIRFTRNGFEVGYVVGENGKVHRKAERFGGRTVTYAYRYDAAGHLVEVKRGGVVIEQYAYNEAGQRIAQEREYRGFTDGYGGTLAYDEAGMLVRAGDAAFAYDERGALAEKIDGSGTIRLLYGKDTALDRVLLPNRLELRYEYDKANPMCPVRKFRGGNLVAEYAWKNATQLSGYLDYDGELEHVVVRDTSGAPHMIQVMPFRPKGPDRYENRWAAKSVDWLESMGGRNSRARLDAALGDWVILQLYCGCDQVGTLRTLVDKDGNLVKEVLYDSFGVPLRDSLPDLFVPIGFAGGLIDPDTRLVRFGYRDYDPQVGRFTAPDPANDTRGDGDIYDYCVDDPVSRVDPTGLWTQATFDESRVSRDEQGRFSSGGGGTLVAAAGQRGTGRSQVIGKQNNLYEMIRSVHGDAVLELYMEYEALFGKLGKAATEGERSALNNRIRAIEIEMTALTGYDNIFSQGFRGEQKQIAEEWKARLTTPDNARKYAALMEAIDSAPLGERSKLVEALYAQLAEDAGMFQTTIRVVDLADHVPEGGVAGAAATGREVLVDKKDYERNDIDWAVNIIRFFHEQAHELMYKFVAESGLSAYPEDVAIMRHAQQNYVRAITSGFMYRRNYTEQHARAFEGFGLEVHNAWDSYRRDK